MRINGFVNRVVDQLSRTTASTTFIPEVDGLRFVAISLVVIHHVSSYLLANGSYAGQVAEAYHAQLFDFGSRGVDLFFTLSGFILALPFARRHLLHLPRQPLRWYFLRRLTRLEPPLLIHLITVGAVRLYQAAASTPHLLAGFLGHLLYVSRIVESYRFNVVLWSLEVEAQFYLLAPLLAMIYKVADQQTRRLSFLGLGVALHFLSPLVFGNTDNFFNYALYFMCGMLVADYYVVGDVGSEHQPRIAALDIAVLALVPVSVVVSNLDWVPELILPLYCGAALLAALQGQTMGRVMRNRVLATIGGMCYTIYLYHYLLIAAVGRVTSNWFGQLPYELFFVLQLSIHSLVIVTACAVVFRVTEKPFMRVSARNIVRALGKTDSEASLRVHEQSPRPPSISGFGNKFRQ